MKMSQPNEPRGDNLQQQPQKKNKVIAQVKTGKGRTETDLTTALRS